MLRFFIVFDLYLKQLICEKFVSPLGGVICKFLLLKGEIVTYEVS